MTKEENSVIEATPPNLAEAFSGPAVFSNKVYLTPSMLGIRLTFMETGPESRDFFRTAVFLAFPDAIALRDLLAKQLEQLTVAVEELKKD